MKDRIRGSSKRRHFYGQSRVTLVTKSFVLTEPNKSAAPTYIPLFRAKSFHPQGKDPRAALRALGLYGDGMSNETGEVPRKTLFDINIEWGGKEDHFNKSM